VLGGRTGDGANHHRSGVGAETSVYLAGFLLSSFDCLCGVERGLGVVSNELGRASGRCEGIGVVAGPASTPGATRRRSPQARMRVRSSWPGVSSRLGPVDHRIKGPVRQVFKAIKGIRSSIHGTAFHVS
jgi:hypothetical protein